MNRESNWQSMKNEWPILTLAAALVGLLVVFLLTDSILARAVAILGYLAYALFAYTRR